MSDAQSQTPDPLEEALNGIGYKPLPELEGDTYDDLIKSSLTQNPAKPADVAQFFVQKTIDSQESGNYDIDSDAGEFTRLFPAYRKQVDPYKVSGRLNLLADMADSLLTEDNFNDDDIALIKPEEEQVFLGLLYKRAAALGKESGDSKDYVKKIKTNFLRGFKGMELNTRQLVENVMGIGALETGVDLANEVAGARELADPSQADNLLGQGFLDLTRQAAPVGTAILTSYATGAVGGAVGLSQKAIKTAATLSGTGFWATQTVPEAYTDLINQGASKEMARSIGIPVGLVQAAIEQLQTEGYKGMASASLKTMGLNYLKTIGGEMGEEGLQFITGSAGRLAASKLDSKVKPWRIGKEWKDFKEEMKRAAVVIPMMTAPGTIS